MTVVSTWAALLIPFLVLAGGLAVAQNESEVQATFALPDPDLQGQKPFESVLRKRRSVREFSSAPLALEELSQLLWAGQGVTSGRGFRTAPSAGALYPLELYIVVGNIEGLKSGIYHYDPGRHELRAVGARDRRSELASAALSQEWVEEAAAVIALVGVPERTRRKYGRRGVRYVHMEVGHAAQNIWLEAIALDLCTTLVGAFDDEAVARVLELPEAEKPFALMPIGRPN
jgi:SagB-type dehydrogenase family enzyme